MSNNGGDCGEKRRGGVEIFFLMPQGKNEKTCSEILSDAYEQSEDNGLTPSWIAADKVMTKKPTKTVRIFFYFSRKMQIKKIVKLCLHSSSNEHDFFQNDEIFFTSQNSNFFRMSSSLIHSKAKLMST